MLIVTESNRSFVLQDNRGGKENRTNAGKCGTATGDAGGKQI